MEKQCSCYIGGEKRIVRSVDGKLEILNPDGSRTTGKTPVLDVRSQTPLHNHQDGLNLFLGILLDPNITKTLPSCFQEMGKEVRSLPLCPPRPAILDIKERWEAILWGFYNREGRFPVFQGVRREEMLGNYINDVMTLIPLKQLRKIIEKTPPESDMANKQQLVIALMRWIYDNRRREFKDVQNTYFRNRELKNQQFDEKGNNKITLSAIEKAGKMITDILDRTDKAITEKLQDQVILEKAQTQNEKKKNNMPDFEKYAKTAFR